MGILKKRKRKILKSGEVFSKVFLTVGNRRRLIELKIIYLKIILYVYYFFFYVLKASRGKYLFYGNKISFINFTFSVKKKILRRKLWRKKDWKFVEVTIVWNWNIESNRTKSFFFICCAKSLQLKIDWKRCWVKLIEIRRDEE